jgi:hypothetical protein
MGCRGLAPLILNLTTRRAIGQPGRCTVVNTKSDTHCTRLSYAASYALTCQYGRWNFLRVQVGLVESDIVFIIFLFICIWWAKSALWSNKNHILKKSRHLVTCCLRWPHYAPPHSHRSLTWLPASVTKFPLFVNFGLGWKVCLSYGGYTLVTLPRTVKP